MIYVWLFGYLACFLNALAQNLKPCIPKVYNGTNIQINCLCNATYCDEFPDLGTLYPNQAAIYTSSQSGKRFVRTTDYFKPGASMSNITLTPNEKIKNQTIIGFGGAFTDATGYNIVKLSAPARQNLIKSYYGPRGIGYTIGRVPIASCDFSTHVYSYDDSPGDMELKNFSLAQDDLVYKIPYIKYAASLVGSGMKLFGSPWSAPAWMKDNNNMTHGGHLLGDVNGPYYITWVNYIIKFFEQYSNNGITFWGVTMQNEPRAVSSFQSMQLNESMERDFAKGVWGTTLRSNSITKNLKLMVMDDSRGSMPRYTNTFFNDSDAAKIVDGVAIHWYDDLHTDDEQTREQYLKHPDKFLLYSEACLLGKLNFGLWTDGDMYLYRIMKVLKLYVAGWTDWNMALDHVGGPNWDYVNDVNSAIIVSNTSDEFEKQPMYYALGHIAKFIVPDSIIIDTKASGIPGNSNSSYPLDFIAAVTPTSQKVLVINNRDSQSTYPLSVINKQGYVLNLSLEPYSFTTIVWNE